MFSAIILAGGSGERMGLGYNKVLYKIKGKTILEYAVQPFVEDETFTEVIVVMNRDDYDLGRVLFENAKVKVVKGGETRQASVYLGLAAIEENDFLMIHDGARPNLKRNSLEKLKDAVTQGSATLFTPVKESVVAFSSNQITTYLDRDQIGLIKTPQAFRTSIIKEAYELTKNQSQIYTDDASMVMDVLKEKIILIEDDQTNIKLTRQEDIKIMEALL